MDTYHNFLCICLMEVACTKYVFFFSLIVQVIRPQVCIIYYILRSTYYSCAVRLTYDILYEPFRSTRLYICNDEVSTCFLTPLATLLSVLPMPRGGDHGNDDKDDDDDFGYTLPGPRIFYAGFRPRRRPRRCLRRSGCYCREIRSARHAWR